MVKLDADVLSMVPVAPPSAGPDRGWPPDPVEVDVAAAVAVAVAEAEEKRSLGACLRRAMVGCRAREPASAVLLC
jgi:hypothetical protein